MTDRMTDETIQWFDENITFAGGYDEALYKALLAEREYVVDLEDRIKSMKHCVLTALEK